MAEFRSSLLESRYTSERSLEGFLEGQQQEQQPHHEHDDDDEEAVCRLGRFGGP